MCDYPNKNLSGAGIVYKFLKMIDDEMWIMGADKYVDLLALALISDSMDITDPETRYYIEIGLSNIRNKCFKALVQKRSYDIKGSVTMNDVSFYITPLINSIIRIGTQEEKTVLFNALIENYMTFKYKKRGQDEIVDEPIYERVARVATNIKSRQDNQIKKSLETIFEQVEKSGMNKNNIIIVKGDKLDKSLTGIVAIKVASKYGKPCLVLRKNENEDGSVTYSGSGRNIDYNPIENLREFISSTNLAKAEGHASAFGVMEVNSKDVPKLIEIFNADDSLGEKVFWVDFIVPFEELTDAFISTINSLKSNWGMGIKEPVICITDIEVQREEIGVIGKNMNTIKISIDGMEFIKFNCDLTDHLVTNEKDTIRIDVVGRCSINEWEGKQIPQIVISDYVVRE